MAEKKSYYDPVKAHLYYERTKKLKGRKKGRKKDPPKASSAQGSQASRARVTRLRGKVVRLEQALGEAMAALTRKREEARQTERKNSDGKTTAKERQESKEYREKNQSKIKEQRETSEKKSSSSSKSSSSRSSSTDVNSMGVEALEERVRRIKGALDNAKKQLSAATTKSGSLRHSSLMVDVGSEKYTDHYPIGRKESVKMVADFGGYATRSNVQCSDGLTILPDAFKEDHDKIVPLLYQHGHGNIENVLGHVKLENREDGVYAHAYFNKTPQGQLAKEQVQHGDFKYLSIFANNLVKNAKRVVKGKIREVSLVLAGANPGATIDQVTIAHGDGEFEVFEDDAVITSGEEIDVADTLAHADEDTNTEDNERTIQDVVNSMNEEQQNVLFYLVGQSMEHDDMDEDDEDDEDEDSDDSENSEGEADSEDEAESDETEGADDDATEETVDGEAEAAADDANDEAGDDGVQHANTNSQEANSMEFNVFDQTGSKTVTGQERQTLSHSEVQTIMQDTLTKGSLRNALGDYALAHGIDNIEYLFPDAKTVGESPSFISRRVEWVQDVLNSVRKTPYARIKTLHADITMEEARARGYIKGNLKKEEFFALLKRETTPQTVYKKQKLDRDDVIDITELDVVAFVKAEMKLMLDEEIAGAILIGDGRSNADEDKIKTDKIRPIAGEDDLYATTVNVNLDDANSSAEEIVDAAINSRQFWKGTGLPTFYTSEAIVAKFLTVKDNFGHRLYKNLQEIADALRVNRVVTVDVMERVPDVVGIMVNLSDYSIGTDRGGQATMFDDFDLDYNKLRYLLETRLCGALTLPKSALVFRKVAGSAVLVTPVKPAFDGEDVTIPSVTGVVYKNADTGATLSAGTVSLTAGQTIAVRAEAASGYYFATSEGKDWAFTNRDES